MLVFSLLMVYNPLFFLTDVPILCMLLLNGLKNNHDQPRLLVAPRLQKKRVAPSAPKAY